MTQDTAKTVKEVKAGRVEFKMDKAANVQVAFGKLSFEAKAITENARVVINALVHADYSQVGAPIRIAFFDDRIDIESPGILLPGMTIELPALFDGRGVHPETMPALPTACAAMINLQGSVHDLLIQAYAQFQLVGNLFLEPVITTLPVVGFGKAPSVSATLQLTAVF